VIRSNLPSCYEKNRTIEGITYSSSHSSRSS